MASTFSPNLKLELIGNGDQSGTWGDTTNKNLGTLIEQAIAGIVDIPISNLDYVLTNFNGTSDQARHAVLNITGAITADRTILVPNGQTKTYVVVNNTTGGFNVNVQTWTGAGLSGTGNIAIIPSGASILIYCTGSNCFTVAPYTAYTAEPIVAQGYCSGTTLTITSVSSGTFAKEQSIYNPGIFWTTSGFPSGTTITELGTGTGGVGTYTISAASTVGSADFPQPIVGLTTLTQIATVDYVQNKLQSPYFQGEPTADTANAAAFEGAVTAITGTSGIVVASKYYVPGSEPVPGYYLNTLRLGQYINGNNVKDGIFISGWGTGTAGNATFTGYISGNLLTVISGSVSGTITNSQYLFANTASINAKITGGSALSWTIDGPPQTIGSVSSPATFIGYGPLLNQTAASNAAIAATGLAAGGWVRVTNDSGYGVTNAVRTPMISYSSPLQLANVLWASNISALVGTLGTQSDSNVAITGGTIKNVTLTESNIAVSSGGTGVQSLNPNAVLTGGTTVTSAVASVLPFTAGNVLTSYPGSSVSAGSFVVGAQYTITSVDSVANFTGIGATSSSITGSVNNAVLTVTAGSGLVVGSFISGGTLSANLRITKFITGTGGVGLYSVSSFTAATVSGTLTALNPIFTATGVGTGAGTATTNIWATVAPTALTNTTGNAPYYGARAFVSFNMKNSAIVSACTYSQAGTQVTLDFAPNTHNYQPGHYISTNITSGSGVDGTYLITAVTQTTVTYIAGTSLATAGTATVTRFAIYNSGNVANVTRITGFNTSFVINFSQAMPYANYVAMGSTGTPNLAANATGDGYSFVCFAGPNTGTGIYSTQSLRGFTTYYNADTTNYPPQLVSVTVFA